MFKIVQQPNQKHQLSNCMYTCDETIKGIYLINDFPVRFEYSPEYEKMAIGANISQRMFFKFTLSDNYNIKITNNNLPITYLKKVTFIINSTSKDKINYDYDEISDYLKTHFNNIPLINDCKYNGFNKVLLQIYATKMEPVKTGISSFINQEQNDNSVKILCDDTEIEILSAIPNIIIPSNNTNLFKSNFNFNEMGIGGLDKEFETIFRRAFSTRLLPQKVLDDLGINHIRGILLYGLPGCGKTLIARKIGKILDCNEPKVVNGPSLLSKYVGESEENVRKLFQDAIDDNGSGKLHLIICDEFDAICKKRGSRNDSTGVNDNVVNQLLSMIDGPKSLNNILLICMTNKKDALDEAVLRPGRLEVQIEIQLPDEKGRYDILKIHTNKMNTQNYLEKVNLNEVATLTPNYTGAELESVVKTAVSYSIAREINPNEIKKNIKPIVTHDDFLKAVDEVKPMFGTKSSELDILTHTKLELLTSQIESIYNITLDDIKKLKNGNKHSVLLMGQHGCGKTKILSHIAKDSCIDCVKFINADTLMFSNDKALQIYEIFEQALKTSSSIVILDSIENIIEYSPLGNIYNNKILQTIYTILNKNIPLNKKIVILMSSSNEALMETFGFDKLTDYQYSINSILNDETMSTIQEYFKIKKNDNH